MYIMNYNYNDKGCGLRTFSLLWNNRGLTIHLKIVIHFSNNIIRDIY